VESPRARRHAPQMACSPDRGSQAAGAVQAEKLTTVTPWSPSATYADVPVAAAPQPIPRASYRPHVYRVIRVRPCILTLLRLSISEGRKFLPDDHILRQDELLPRRPTAPQPRIAELKLSELRWICP